MARLCALLVLALVLMGDASKESEVSLLVQQGTVCGYRRFWVHSSDFPTAKKRNDRMGFLDGYIISPLTQTQRRKLDNYEEARDIEETIIWFNEVEGYMTRVLADIWVWEKEEDFFSGDPCDLEKFKSVGLSLFE
ncbi:hypothetical protein QBC43DRAFT_25979 [Cladorrhinum sp. PSN259]|nr:hypothetical protein QBC43DRAFT_25979 [Cladorrhinum sp. PSN259]